MAANCGSPAKGANGSCCPTKPDTIAASPVPAYSHEQAQRPAVVAHEGALPALVSFQARYGNALEFPHLIFSPGGSSILRI
jgi:hypothetical protein